MVGVVVCSLKGKCQSKSTEDYCHRMIENGDARAAVAAAVILSHSVDGHGGEACDSCRYPWGMGLESDR